MPFQLSKWQKRRSRCCCKRRTSVPLWGRSETNEDLTLFAPRCVQGTIRFKQLFSWAVFSIPPQVTCFWAPPHSCPNTTVHSCVSWRVNWPALVASCLWWSGLGTLATQSLTRTREEIVPRAAWERCTTEADVEQSIAVPRTVTKLFSIMRCQKISWLEGDGV